MTRFFSEVSLRRDGDGSLAPIEPLSFAAPPD
jgi:hypothetical protein